MIPNDLLSKLRLAATVAIATTACSRNEVAPAPAPDATPTVATPLAIEDASPPPIDATVQEQIDAGVDAAVPQSLGVIGIGRGDDCPGCGMGGRLIHDQELKPATPKGACVMSTTEPEVASAKPRFLACYNRGLALNPDVGGKVVLQLKVGDNGEVLSADVAATTLNNPAIEACLRSVAQRLQLKPGKRTVTVPLVLRHDHT